MEAHRRDLEPVPGRKRALQQEQPAADRVDREVEPAVVVVIGDGKAAADDARRCGPKDSARVRECSGRSLRGAVLEHLHRLRIPSQVPDGDRAVGEHEIRVAIEVEVGPGRAPAGERAAERGGDAGPAVGERRAVLPRRLAGEDGVPLAARVADEEVRKPVAVDVRVGDPHARVRVCGAGAAGTLLEAEAEPGRIRSGAAGPGDVLVQPVRVFVVGDVEVEAAVAVEIGEDRTERVIEPRRLEPGLPSDFAEPDVPASPAALVEVEAGRGRRRGRSGTRIGA